MAEGAGLMQRGVVVVGVAGDVAPRGGAYPVEVEVCLPAVAPEEDGGLGVGPGDRLPAHKEPHHGPQHQRRVQRPEGQRGPQPLRPAPRLLCVRTQSGPGLHPGDLHPVPTTGSPSRWSSSHSQPKGLHADGVQPNSLHPMASAPWPPQHPPPQSSPISYPAHDPPADGLHPMATSILMVSTPLVSMSVAFIPSQPEQPPFQPLQPK